MKRIEGVSMCPTNCLCSRDLQITYKVVLGYDVIKGHSDVIPFLEHTFAVTVHLSANWLYPSQNHHK